MFSFRRLASAGLTGAALIAATGLVLGLEPPELFRAVRGRPVTLGERPARQVPSAAQRPEPSDPEWTAMTHALTRMSASYRGQVGIYLKDLETGREWTYNADDRFAAASLIKIPVMMAVFQKVSDGDLSLSKQVTLRRRDRAGGSGALKWSRDGSRFTVRETLLRMMRDSDNTATNMLLREVGMAYVQRHLARQGVVHTDIHEEGLSLRGSAVRQENYTTAREMGALLDKMHRGEMVDGFSSQLMLELMSQKKVRSRLSKRLPVGWKIAHKTGLLRRACHDVGIVTTPKGSFIVAVLTGGNRDYPTAKEFISRIGSATFAYYKGDYGLFARGPSHSGAASSR